MPVSPPHRSHLSQASNAATPPPSSSSPRSSALGSSGGEGALQAPTLVRPALKPLKVALPPETEFEVMASSDSFCYSPTTPAPKPGIKERMKFYFQRQAGGAAGI
jgi:hypothetical protein